MDLRGAVCLITGASRGIGRETARALHARGAEVGLVARDREELDALAGELGDGAVAAPADVTDDESLAAAVAVVAEQLGGVDVLVNNAGAGAYEPFVDAHPESFRRLMELNYFATVAATRLVLPAMVDRGRGHIVNVASIAGRVGAPFETAYSASKFAVVGFSEALAAEVGPLGVRVSLVNPGPVATSFTDARGVDFQRRFPRPLAATTVAAAVVRAVERDRFDQVLPRWLGVGIVTRAVAPGLYRRGLLRSTKDEALRRAPRR